MHVAYVTATFPFLLNFTIIKRLSLISGFTVYLQAALQRQTVSWLWWPPVSTTSVSTVWYPTVHCTGSTPRNPLWLIRYLMLVNFPWGGFFFGYQRFDVELQIMWPPACCTQVVVNYHNADLTPRELAMLDFAMAVCRSDTITEQHFQDLEKHGFDREDAWDIAAIAAFFAMSNRLAHLTDMRPNLDFYNMGRVPRNKSKEDQWKATQLPHVLNVGSQICHCCD